MATVSNFALVFERVKQIYLNTIIPIIENSGTKNETHIANSLSRFEQDLLELRNNLQQIGILKLDSRWRREVLLLVQQIWNRFSSLSTNTIMPTELVCRTKQTSCSLLALCWVDNTTHRNYEIFKCFVHCAKSWMFISNIQTAEELSSEANLLIPIITSGLSVESVSESERFKMKKSILQFQLLRLDNNAQLQNWNQFLQIANDAYVLVDDIPSEASKLSQLMYNFGLNMYQDKNYDLSVKALTISFESYEKDPNKEDERQAKTFRLLSSAYIELGNLTSALNCVKMAINTNQCAANYLLQTKILLMQNRVEESMQSILATINTTDCTIPIAMTVISLATEYKLNSVAKAAYEALLKRNPDQYQISAKYLEFLLSKSVNEIVEAKILLTNLLDSYADNPSAFDKTTLNRFHLICWNYALDLFETRLYNDSVTWFQFAYGSLLTDDRVNKSKCLRYLSRSYIEMQNFDSALPLALEAEKLDHCLQSLFLLIVVHLNLGEETKSVDLLQQIATCDDFKSDFFVLLAQEAFDRQKKNFAATCLAKYLEQISISKETGLILRNIIFLLMDQDFEINSNRNQLVHFYATLLEKIKLYGKAQLFENSAEQEMEWILGVAWTKAMDWQRKNFWEDAIKLFDIIGELIKSENCSKLNDLEMQRMAYFLKSYLLISIAESSSINTNNSMLVEWRSALTSIDLCRKVSQKINEMKRRQNLLENNSNNNSISFETSEFHDRYAGLLYLSEFYCRVVLLLHTHQNNTTSVEFMDGLETLKLIVDKLSKCSEFEKNLETAVSICQLRGAVFYPLAQLCLTKLIQRLDVNSICLEKLIHCYRLIYQFTLKREDGFQVLNDLLVCFDKWSRMNNNTNWFNNAIATSTQIKIDLQWLILEAHNNGIYYFKICKHQRAEAWLSKSISLCNWIQELLSHDLLEQIHQHYAQVLKFVSNNSTALPVAVL